MTPLAKRNLVNILSGWPLANLYSIDYQSFCTLFTPDIDRRVRYVPINKALGNVRRIGARSGTANEPQRLLPLGSMADTMR
jgi:hypothetical protein